MQFKPKHLLSQMTKHNAAPEASQESMFRDACEGEAVSSRPPREAKSRTPRMRRLDPFSIFWKMIIRPPRAEYSVGELGPKAFKIDGSSGSYLREDVQLTSVRGERLHCSHFRPFHTKGAVGSRALPCVVYLHGNCSSRLEALDILDELLPRGMSVFCFDFAGSGHSEGEYVTLGHNEEQDLKVVLEHLRKSGRVGHIALWGRSMGAATSILRAAEDRELAACVLDSPFSSLPDVARELAHSMKLKMPEMLVGAALKHIRSEIKARTGVDIEDLRPIQHAPKATTPVLFAVAKDDEFVQAHHTFALHDAWGGEDRELVTLSGGHNSARPRDFLRHAAEFIQEKQQNLDSRAAMVTSESQPVLSETSSTVSTRAPPSRASSQELVIPSAEVTSESPPALTWSAGSVAEAPGAQGALARPTDLMRDLPVTCRAALARTGLGSCLEGCFAGVTLGSNSTAA